MAETSMFRGVLNFFVDLGIYDVVLPFLLVFAIMFAILDKTLVFGYENVNVKGTTVKYPRKNINAMVAFVVAFFVVASAKLVEVITQVSSQMVIFLLLIVLFMTLYGSFMTQSAEGIGLSGVWAQGFMVVALIGIVLIFLNALDWLYPLYNFLKDHWSNELVASVILLLTIIGAMLFITKDKKDPPPAATGSNTTGQI